MSQSDKTPSTITFPWKDILTFLGVVLAAYLAYLGARSPVEIPMQATQTAEAKSTIIMLTATPIFTPTPKPISYITILLNHYNNFGYDYTWVNNDNTIGAAKITDVQIDGNNVTMKYDYNNGVLKGVLVGNTLSGTWHQDNSNGSFELIFVTDFSSATGWWDDIKDADPKPKYEFGIK